MYKANDTISADRDSLCQKQNTYSLPISKVDAAFL